MSDNSVPPSNPPQPADAFHEPVLASEVLEILNPQPGMVCLDCTVGLGGHAALIAPKLAPGGRYIGLDVDPTNLAIARKRLSHAATGVTVDLVRSNFASAPRALADLGVKGVDLLLADLGFSSNQMGNPAKGLSFNTEGPLDMRLNPALAETAADLVNRLPETELADLIYRYGQDRLSRKIARKIIEQRDRSPINTTTDLAKLVRSVYGRASGKGAARRRQKIDPATRTFMALRIAVNAELVALEQLLGDLSILLRAGAVAAVISFHSLEDRLVKRAFADLRRAEKAQTLTRKPVTADRGQRHANPRSRSAKLRATRWIATRARSDTDC